MDKLIKTKHFKSMILTKMVTSLFLLKIDVQILIIGRIVYIIMKNLILLFFFQLCLSQIDKLDVDSIAHQLRLNIQHQTYDVRTDNGYGTDCMRVNYQFGRTGIAVFHKLNQQTGYFQLYYTESPQLDQWTNTVKLSQRGAQGTILKISDSQLLVAYSLQNKQNGNTIAIRFYQGLSKLRENNFLYEYQLSKQISGESVINIGSPILQSLVIVNTANHPQFNSYQLKIGFSYYPGGSFNYPGYGYVNLNPLRDFVNNNGNWIGGAKQNYADWKGYADNEALTAIRQAGCGGTIQHGDYFDIASQRYYLYDCNMNPDFDWNSWRIFLYSPSQNKAVNVGFNLGRNINMLCPHIHNVNNYIDPDTQEQLYIYFVTFFLPSQGVPGTRSKAGQFFAINAIWI